MKKFTKAVAATMALTLAMGMGVMAADSSTTENTNLASAPAVSYVVYRDSASTVTRAAAVPTASGEVVRVAADYSEVTDNKAIGTAIKPDAATADAVADYLATEYAGRQVLVSGVKVQLYNAGKAITDGFGTYRAIVGVGARYNGQTVTAIVRHQDGTYETLELTVTNGRVVVPLTVTGTVAIVL